MKRKQFYLPEKQIELLEAKSEETGSSVSEVLRQQIQGLENTAAVSIPQTVPVVKNNQPHNCPAEALGTSYASSVSGTGDISLASCDSSFYSRNDDGSSVLTNYNLLKYNNLLALRFPYQNSGGFINIREAIRLCQTAWYNVPIFRQTIEAMTFLANSGIKLFGGTTESKEFFYAWFEKVNLFNLTEQYFRESFLSSNTFLYRYDGGIKLNRIDKFIAAGETEESSDKTKIKDESVAARTIDIPVKYIVLDPAGLCIQNNTDLKDYNPIYYRLMDVGTKQKLKNLTKKDAVKIDLEKSLQDLVNNEYGQVSTRLDPDHLYPLFYQKQDYQPFAMPMGFPVLEDINLKLEFKKCDAVVAKTVESIIMLVTHGNEPDKGGMNPVVDAALKTVFRTKQGGRTLVSDYTTKIDFIIPDINKVIGSAKYDQIDQDIMDGLMNIFYGEKKLANITIKLRLFVQMLVYAQKLFLNQFLVAEMKRVGKLVGFTDAEIPTPKFNRINMEDRANSDRFIAQLAQLGLLTAEDTFEAVESGLLPINDNIEERQKVYKKQRKDGLFYPLVGGSADPDAVPAGAAGVKKPVKSGKKAISTKDGRPQGVTAPRTITTKASEKYQIDVNKFKNNILLANVITNDLTKAYTKKYGFSDDIVDKVRVIGTHLITNEKPENWGKCIKSYIKELPEPNVENISLAIELQEQNDVDDFTAGLLVHCVVE